MLEFKLQLYFEKYKDTSIISTSSFRRDFIKKHGEFELLGELINMIHKYQYKKYGNLLTYGNKIEFLDFKKCYHNEVNRQQKRLGTIDERKRRKLREEHNG